LERKMRLLKESSPITMYSFFQIDEEKPQKLDALVSSIFTIDLSSHNSDISPKFLLLKV
jgi:hypothetical protein